MYNAFIWRFADEKFIRRKLLMKKRTFRFAAAFAAAIMIFPVSAAGVQASETDPAQARASVTPAEELPEDYIREALADPSVETVRVSVLKSADTVPQDILNTLGEEDKTLTVAVYADASDQYPEYEWQFNGILGLDYVNGDFDLGVSIDLPDVREGAAEYIGDDSVPFTAFSLEQEGDIPNGAWLSLPVAGSMFELQNVYSYDREQGKLMSQNGSAGFSDNHSNGWWVTVRSFYDGGGDYIVTPSGLDYENKIYGDIEEAERKIMEKLQSDDPVVNIRMGYYWGNEYVLSTETLNAVRKSGKTLNITWPGVEASATYIWTFHGSEMGEVTVPVNLLVLFPLDNDETVTAIDGKMTNQPRRIVLDFQHSGPLPAGTDFATLSFSFDNIDAGQDGYYYYYDEAAGKLQCSGRASWYMGLNYGMEMEFVRMENLSHCSYYVITDVMAEGPDVDNTMPEEPGTEEPEGPGTTDPEGPGTGAEDPENLPQPSGGDGNETEGADGQNKDNGSNGKNPGTTSPKTGDGYGATPVLCAVISCGIAVYALRKRRTA